jgi:hypothetical protein
MALQTRFSTFKEFYPFYLTQHADATCRALHFVGTTLVMISFVAGLISGNLDVFCFDANCRLRFCLASVILGSKRINQLLLAILSIA